jgi:predicted short-subunit dehydrogenase-like oxidoreductase (DUF2520 family)
MLQVVIIGSGNVAQHLIKAFGNLAQAQLVQAFARHPEQLAALLPPEKITNSFNAIADADVYIIAVKDDAIAALSAQLPFSGRLVVHTSGSMGLEQLDNKNRRGVFYPLQTFSKNKDLDFTTVPLCLESEFEKDYTVLELLAKTLSESVYKISSEQRQSLHVAAVFASNFSNQMYALSNKICTQNNIPFGILNPLIQETADKIKTLSPIQAQTGPAVRHDQKTIQKHLAFLKNDNQKAIYTLLTQSIQQTHEQ